MSPAYHHDYWYGVLRKSPKYLDGKPFEMPALRPDTPVHGMQEMLDDEKPTEQDIDGYIFGTAK